MENHPRPWKLKKINFKNFGIFDAYNQQILGEEVLFKLVDTYNVNDELLEASKKAEKFILKLDCNNRAGSQSECPVCDVLVVLRKAIMKANGK